MQLQLFVLPFIVYISVMVIVPNCPTVILTLLSPPKKELGLLTVTLRFFVITQSDFFPVAEKKITEFFSEVSKFVSQRL